MTFTVSMDRAGRLVLPKAVRERYGLGGAPHELELVDTAEGILLRPKAEFVPVQRTKSGWLVFESPLGSGEEPIDPVAAVERMREERIRHIMGED